MSFSSNLGVTGLFNVNMKINLWCLSKGIRILALYLCENIKALLMETFLVNQIYTALSDFKPGYMVLVHYQKWKNSSQNIIRLTYFCYKNMALFINSPDPDIHNHQGQRLGLPFYQDLIVYVIPHFWLLWNEGRWINNGNR